MARPLRVALLQLEARELADHDRAWGELLRAIDEAALQDPELIVLPEASYPAYFLQSREAYEDAAVHPDQQVLSTLAARASQHGVYLAAGLVLRGANGLENTCVLFDPDGHEVGRYVKSFLWHFDRRWFQPGRQFPVFELTFPRAGRASAGILICSDSRLEEIPRAYAIEGARLIIDPTAWVSSGRDPQHLSNPQIEFLMPARAVENGTWIVCADKTGSEAHSVVYAGQSGVISPTGEWVVRAPSSGAGIVVYELDLDAAAGPPIARRPELFGDLGMTADLSEAARLAREPLIAEDAAARVGAAAMDASPSAVALVEGARQLVRAASTQDAAIVVLPDLAGADTHAVTERETLPLLEALAHECSTMIAVVLAERVDAATFKTQYLIDPSGVIASHRQTHLSDRERRAGFTAGDRQPPVIETIVGQIGLLAGAEGLVPELAQSLKLRGSELIAWSAGDIGTPLRTFARARALEHHCYVVAAGATGDDGGGYVIAPAGGVLTETLPHRAMVMTADINRLLARWNDMAPGTNPILDRAALHAGTVQRAGR
ncbi:MAG: carbon-nitrogen hydrolase family protein [Chloroflexi bacterium]|nr:carbon-nitrogen hydrolase family protein [Chloroflexota bacterium]MDA1145501.1 carbon-nitrogen hydrolase family protein [Chloroflexota bacterium]